MVEANSQRGSRRSMFFLLALIIVPCAIFAGFFVRHRLACREAFDEVRRLGGKSVGLKSGEENNIGEVDLSGTAVTDKDLPILVSRLVPTNGPASLKLARTAITDAGLEDLKPLTHLVRLDLSETRVTGPGLAWLWRFGEQSDSSADLSLARTPIQDDSLVHLQNWRWLQHLDLSHTKITDRGLAFLEAMGPMLSRVDIGGTEVTDHGVEQLKSSHPGLSINR